MFLSLFICCSLFASQSGSLMVDLSEITQDVNFVKTVSEITSAIPDTNDSLQSTLQEGSLDNDQFPSEMNKDDPGLKARECDSLGGVSNPSQNKGLKNPVLKGGVSSVMMTCHSENFGVTSKNVHSSPFNHFYYYFNRFESAKSLAIMADGTTWKISWWFTSNVEKWRPGERIKISYYSSLLNSIQLTNIDRDDSSWGSIDNPYGYTVEDVYRSETGLKLKLNRGWVFYCESVGHEAPQDWEKGDRICVFDYESSYSLWNIDKSKSMPNCRLLCNENVTLELENKLSSRILGQAEAVNIVTHIILNHASGLKDPKKPIATFLFIGPTGVGKTELAKALTDCLYQSRDHLIRFDMTSFSEEYAITRLVGTPPGYKEYDEGGQLTEALKRQPQSIVLLDEIEKAHPKIHKVFLSLFDEGLIVDSHNDLIACQDTIFVMTSNLCSKEIAAYFRAGLTSEEVLGKIENKLMEALSPEFYNRLRPVIFKPFGPEVMADLVNLELNDLIKRVKISKNLNLIIDDSVRKYLIENGYHPDLGARPLKLVIEKKVVAALAVALISEYIPENSQVTIFYFPERDSWFVEWLKS